MLFLMWAPAAAAVLLLLGLVVYGCFHDDCHGFVVQRQETTITAFSRTQRTRTRTAITTTTLSRTRTTTRRRWPTTAADDDHVARSVLLLSSSWSGSNNYLEQLTDENDKPLLVQEEQHQHAPPALTTTTAAATTDHRNRSNTKLHVVVDDDGKKQQQQQHEKNESNGVSVSAHHHRAHPDAVYYSPTATTTETTAVAAVAAETSNSEGNNNILATTARTNNTRTRAHQTAAAEDDETTTAEMDKIMEEENMLKMVSSEVSVKKLLGENPYAWTDIDLTTIMNRILDSVEDSTQKNNGKFKGQSRLRRKTTPAQQRPTVLVLGTGWAAHAFIKVASTYDLRIVVVSPVNHFVFTPMLASASVGTIEYRSMTEPIRVTNPYIDNFVEGRGIGVDVDQKLLTVQLTSLSTVTGAFKGIAAHAPCRLEPEEPEIQQQQQEQQSTTTGIIKDATQRIQLHYDYLICAVGTSVRSDIVPGAKQYCFNLKTSQDSKRLRTAIGEALEYASRPDVQTNYYPDDNAVMQGLACQERKRRVRFAIVGGGPTGVELAGELSDFIGQICSKPDGAFQHLADDIDVVLIHGGPELLPAMDSDLRHRALEALEAQGIHVLLNFRLQEVGSDFIRIRQKGSTSDEDEYIVPVGLTCWAAGNAPVPFVRELLNQLPESAAGSGGRINVDQWLRCPTLTPETFGSILVLGDVACLQANGKYESPEEQQPLPQTAQVAGQQGAFCARMLNRRYDLRQTPPILPSIAKEAVEAEDYPTSSLLRPWLLARGLETAPEFTFLNLGLLAYIGGGEALNQVKLGDVPIFNYSGLLAYTLWRTVYLTKQAATRNQALIAFDWLRTELFGRDITRL